jgi:single-stranded-DNA-specific exonuclease
VYGDFDCDGVCAAVLLYTFLLSNGADVCYHINSRAAGFGLNEADIRALYEDGVKLIITVDNGISAIEEAKLIKSLGMSLIVTDHHEPIEVLPEAIAVVDPHRADNTSSFREYCGCGVALMLVAALMEDTEAALEQFSDITALATVADMVKIVGENRVIVNHGLHYFMHTENLGLKALMDVSGIKTSLTAVHFGFALGPRINAAGRIEHADIAFELLTTEDPDRAKELAKKIDDLNTARKTIEADVIKKAKEYLSAHPESLYRRVIVMHLHDANHGVIGLAAGKILEMTGKPVFLMTDDENETLRGSARSVPGFSVVDAFSTLDCLTKCGGHALAGGFSLKAEDFTKFADGLEDFARNTEFATGVSINAAKILTAVDLTTENAKAISALEPFGQGFTEPLFILQNALLTDVSYIGSYIRISLKYENKDFSANIYKIPPDNFTFFTGDNVDILTYFGSKSSYGKDYLNFRITDIRLSGLSQTKILNAISAFESYKRGEYDNIDRETLSRVIPTHEECAKIYSQLTGFIKSKSRKFIPRDMLIERNHHVMNAFKLLLILDIFNDAKLIKHDYFDGKITLVNNPAKADLAKTETMLNLLSLYK